MDKWMGGLWVGSWMVGEWMDTQMSRWIDWLVEGGRVGEWVRGRWIMD